MNGAYVVVDIYKENLKAHILYYFTVLLGKIEYRS